MVGLLLCSAAGAAPALPPAEQSRETGAAGPANAVETTQRGEATETAVRAARVFVIPITGTIEKGLTEFVLRGFREALDAQGSPALRRPGAPQPLVLLEVNTFGGLVDAATEIRDAVLASPVPVYAFVTQRAWSAGALITLAAEKVVMAPASSIGAAEPRPVDEKTVAALRSEFEATAEARGRDPRVAGAMVDKAVAIEGLVAEGEILSLSATRAVQWGIADGIAPSREEALAVLGVEAVEVVVLAPNWAERVVRFLTDPYVSSALLTLGFLGLLYEVTSPGWGIPGTAGLAALVLFFGSRLLTGLAEFDALLLFLLGIGLLALEVFVVPGFGLAGVPGLLAILYGIHRAFADAQLAAYSLLVSLLVAGLVLALTLPYIRRVRPASRLVLGARLTTEEGYVAPARRAELLGRVGRALTPLKPAGVVNVDGQRVDAVSDGGWIAAGATVRVVAVEGMRVVVRQEE